MSSLKGPDFQGCLSPAECGAEVWGRMKRAAAERLLQRFGYRRGGWVGGWGLPPCLPLRSPCGYTARVSSAFTLHQLLLGQSWSEHFPGMLSVARGLRFALLPLIVVLSHALLPFGFQKLAVVETVIIQGTAGRRERFFCLKHFVSSFVHRAKDSLRLHLVTVLACPAFEINKSSVTCIKLQL